MVKPNGFKDSIVQAKVKTKAKAKADGAAEG